MYTTLLFDFDGTLTPSLDLWMEAYKHAITFYGLELEEEEIIAKWFYSPYTTICNDFKLPSPQELDRLVEEGLEKAWSHAYLFPAVMELLDCSSRSGYKIGLVTSGYRNQVYRSLEQLDIKKYFDAIVTAADVKKYKPHPEPVLKALEQIGTNPKNTLFVGDYEVDIMAGKAAGTSTALFLPQQNARYYDFAALRANTPDFVFSEYRELINHLQLTC
jgi:pyrophosphatase PpaX